jgi:hypothetical protein
MASTDPDVRRSSVACRLVPPLFGAAGACLTIAMHWLVHPTAVAHSGIGAFVLLAAGAALAILPVRMPATPPLARHGRAHQVHRMHAWPVRVPGLRCPRGRSQV